MSDLRVDCDWRDDTLYIVLSKDPECIGVRLFPSRQAPVRRYVPEAELLRLKERYAKLLDEKIDAYNDMVAATLEADELGAENAKLRERVDTLEWLLKLTLKYAEEGELGGYELCDLCDRIGTCENHPATSCTRTFDTSSDFIRDRMRELGVEVGDA